MKKRAFILWGIVCIFLSACVYCSLPLGEKEKSDVPAVETEETLSDEEAWDNMVEAYFAGRPVRDVPERADFSAFLVGTLAQANRDYAKVADSYASVLKNDPDNKEIKERLYLYYVLAGQVDKAIPYAYQALDERADDALPQMVIIASDVKQENYAQALAQVQNVKANYDNFLKPLLNAWLYAGMKDEKKAIDSLSVLAQEPSFKAAYYLHLALIQDYFGHTDKAAAAYGELMKLKEAKNVRVLLLLKEFEARTHALSDKRAFAIQYTALQEESFISKEMMISPGDGERVRSPIQGISWVFFDMASALGQSSGLDFTLFFAKLAQYLNPTSSIGQLFMGEILEALELPEQANDLYRKVNPSQNIFLSVQMRTVMNWIKMGKTDLAVAKLKELIKAHAGAPLFHMTLGDAYRETGDCTNAVAAYQAAEKLILTGTRQAAPIYFYQGVCYEGENKLEKASEMFEKALALDGENPVYLNYTGYTWLQQNKKVPDALKLIEKAVASMPEDGNMLDSLGWAYYKLGDYEKALEVLENAVMLEAGNAVINSHLGDAYWRVGRFREARFQWAHAMSLKQASSAQLKAELSEKQINGLKE